MSKLEHGTGEHSGGSHCSTDFIYFAAHAPEIPAWFERKEWEEDMQVSLGRGMVGIRSVKMAETRMEHLVRWRIEYAKAMVDSLSNVRDHGHLPDGAAGAGKERP
jgi:hypothetical protein